MSKLGLCWDEALTFVLGDDFIIRKLKFTDVIQDKLDGIEAETAAEQFDADFSVMSLTLQQLIQDLIQGLGGEDQEKKKNVYTQKATLKASTIEKNDRLTSNELTYIPTQLSNYPSEHGKLNDRSKRHLACHTQPKPLIRQKLTPYNRCNFI